MTEPLPLLLENLVRYRADLDEARALFERQMAACLEVHGTTEIARALGVGKSAISHRRRRNKESEKWKTG